MVSADPILKHCFADSNQHVMEAVYNILIRELQQQARLLRKKLQQKKRRIKLLIEIQELQNQTRQAQNNTEQSYQDDFQQYQEKISESKNQTENQNLLNENKQAIVFPYQTNQNEKKVEQKIEQPIITNEE